MSLTQVTAQRSMRSIDSAQPRRLTAEVPLLLFRRLKDQAIYEAKKTKNGIPITSALLERAWIEQHVSPTSPNHETSFGNCCRMLGEDESAERIKALKEIDRHWHKALIDWGRKQWQTKLEAIETMKAEDNPAWAARRAIQSELPLPEGAN